MPSPHLLSPEAPCHGLHWKISKLITSLAECDRESLKLDIRSRKSEIPDDIIDTLASQLEDLDIGMIYQGLCYFLPIFFASWLVLYDALQLSFFRITQPALFSPLRFQEALARLALVFIDLAMRKFFISLRISDTTTTNDVGGGASALEVSVTQKWTALVGIYSDSTNFLEQAQNARVCSSESCDNIRSSDSFLSEFVVDWGKLVHEFSEQKHNPPVRRSKSCESIKSVESFLSDPVIDWKELLYGCNR